MSSSSKRVLVAEDEYLIRLVAVDDLLAAGYEVIEAGRGQTAIKMLNGPDHVDVLVTAIRLPGADGLKVAAAARARYPTIPIIFHKRDIGHCGIACGLEALRLPDQAL